MVKEEHNLTEKLAQIDECIETLQSILDRCDSYGIAMAGIHLDQAIQILVSFREQEHSITTETE